MDQVEVDGQLLHILTNDEWDAVSQSKTFDLFPISAEIDTSILNAFLPRVERFKHYNALQFAVAIINNKALMCYELLSYQQQLIRVFVENVFCWHCQKRAGISATPFTDGLIGLNDEQRLLAQQKISTYPIADCPHCLEPLSRRHTIWLAPTDDV